MNAARSITKTFSRMMVVLTSAAIGLIAYIWISSEYEEFNKLAASLREEYIQSQKDLIRDQTEHVVDYIEFKKSQKEERLEKCIRNRAREAHDIALNLYTEHKGAKSQAEIEKIVKDALRPIRFNNGRGYYFATRLDGVEMLFADNPEMENQNLIDMQDTQGKFVIRDIIDIARKQGEGFYNYTWTKPNKEGKDFPKIAYIIYFEPFDWFIGTGEYLDDVESDIKGEVLERIEDISFGKDGYIFAGQWDGLSLVEPQKGKNMIDITDADGVKIVRELIQHAKSGSGYVNYVMPSFEGDTEPHPKLSYAQGIPDWEWYVGAGINMDEIEATVHEMELAQRAEIRSHILGIAAILIGILTLNFLLQRLFAKRIEKSFGLFLDFFSKAEEELTPMDQGGLRFNEFQQLAHSVNQMVEKRAKTEQALQQSEEQYRLHFENADDVIYSIDREFKVTSITPSVERIMGYRPDEMIGKRLDELQIIPPEYLDMVVANTLRVFEGKRVGPTEYELIAKGGRRVFAEMSAAPIIKDGEVVGGIDVGRDITERKRAEKLLSAEKDTAQKYLDVAGVIFVAIDADEKIMLINRKGIKVLGFEEQEVVGENWFDIFIPEKIREDVRTVFQELMSGKIDPVEYFANEIVTKNGEERVIAWHNTVLTDEMGNSIGTLSSGEDITEQRIAKLALEESEKRYRLLLNNSNTGICVIQDGVYRFANSRLAEMTGYEAEELVGKPMIDLHHPDEQSIVSKDAEIVMSGSKPESRPYRILRKDGTEIWTEINGTPIEYLGRPAILADVLNITERKKAEDMLRESEARLSSIFLAAPTGIGLVSNRIIMEANEQLCVMVGYSREELIGQSARILYLSDEDYELVGQEKYAQIEERGTGTVETRFKRKDGRIIDVLLSSTPLDPGDLTIGVTFTALDITDRKRNEAEIQQQKEHLEDVIESLTYPFYIIDVDDYTIKTANSASGLSEGSICHIATHNSEKPCKSPEHPCPLEETKKTKRPTTVEHIHYDKDGNPRYVEIHAYPILDEQGNVVQMIEYCVDITERKMAEAEVEVRLQFEQLLSDLSARFVALMPDKVDAEIQHALKLLIDFLNVDRSSLSEISRKDGKLHVNHSYAVPGIQPMNGIIMDEWFPWHAEKLRRGEVIVIERIEELPDEATKEYCKIEGVKSQLCIPLAVGGSIVGAASFCSYKAERTWPEELVMRLKLIGEVFANALVRRRVEEEQQTLEEQLRQAQKMEAVGTLAGGVAHDFNNLLTAILGHTQLAMLSLPEDSRAYQDLMETEAASVRAAEVVRQLLAFSRKQVIRPQAMSLENTLDGMGKMLTRLIREDIELVIRPNPDLWNVMADPGQVEQVLVNLIVNARDALPEGGRISIEAYNFQPHDEISQDYSGLSADRYVTLAVTDDGHGIPQEVIDRIFEPFFTTKPEGQGTGLGLATIYGIVKQHGGEIVVDSKPGQGTTFKVFWPAVEVEVEKKSLEEDKRIPTGLETILVVEDEANVKDMVVKVLSNQGYNILEASNGLEALALLDELNEPPALLLTDTVMPKMGGEKLAKEFTKRFPDAGVLFVSGYTDAITLNGGILKPGVNFLEKPFTPSRLAQKIREVLDRAPAKTKE